MKQDTIDFLDTLLWLADDPDKAQRELMGKTVYDFSDAFVAGVEAFVAEFRRHLIDTGVRPAVLATSERSFGGNVYLSLSGHGAGFFDDRNPQVAEMHERIKMWAGSCGRADRFFELDGMLDVGEDGKIDLSFLPEHIDAQRAALFAVPGAQVCECDPFCGENCGKCPHIS